VACLALLVACSSIPTITQPAADGREAAGGSDPATLLSRHLAREQTLAGRPLPAKNRAVLLQNGPNTYQAMVAAILAATDHINVETYILDDDEVGQRFADVLIERQQAGLQVNLIRDSVGTIGTPNAFFSHLTAAGISVVEFNPVNPLSARAGWRLNQRDHRKLLIVDGRIAFLGGINISSVYSGGSFRRNTQNRPDGSPPWRDTDLQLQGPVVADLQKLFLANWGDQRGDALGPGRYFPDAPSGGTEIVRALGSDPDGTTSPIYASLIGALRDAQREIWITNAYFVPDKQLVAALTSAVARGVDVRVVLPTHMDSWLVKRASHSHYAKLLRAGVHLYQRRDVVLHVKTAVIDGVWSSVGSTNLDSRSVLHNQELSAVILGVEFGAEMRAAFLADQALSDPITARSWSRRPASDRFTEMLGRLWEYWL
jgi:cardiolipin synthase